MIHKIDVKRIIVVIVILIIAGILIVRFKDNRRIKIEAYKGDMQINLITKRITCERQINKLIPNYVKDIFKKDGWRIYLVSGETFNDMYTGNAGNGWKESIYGEAAAYTDNRKKLVIINGTINTNHMSNLCHEFGHVISNEVYKKRNHIDNYESVGEIGYSFDDAFKFELNRYNETNTLKTSSEVPKEFLWELGHANADYERYAAIFEGMMLYPDFVSETFPNASFYIEQDLRLLRDE